MSAEAGSAGGHSAEGGVGRDAGLDPHDQVGCGPLNEVAHCSACGVACDMATGSPYCDGSGCSYACNAGRMDCNASAAPNADGCECAGDGCCGRGCQTAHRNGIGDAFYDCEDSGTFDQGQATKACAAFTGASGACSASASGCDCLRVCQSVARSVCGTSGGACYCWQYAGPHPGTVQAPEGFPCGASCGGAPDPTWN